MGRFAGRGAGHSGGPPAVDRYKLFKRAVEERGRLVASLEGLSLEDLTTPGVTRDYWSIKDIVAHISAWQEEGLAALRAMLAGQKWDVKYDIDYWIQQKYNERKDRNWEQVWEGWHLSHRQMCDLLLGIPDERLGSEEVIGWIAQTTYDHYLEHCEQVLAWRLKRRPPVAIGEG